MNKKKQMTFNLNNFLLSMSIALDKIESRYFNISDNHSKRVAYISLKLALEFNYKKEALFDICAYSFMHNIALKGSKEDLVNYCEFSDNYSKKLPFLFKEQKNVLKYQCEYYDGSGTFSLKEEDIPLFSQFISFAVLIDRTFDLGTCTIEKRKEILRFLKENENKLFSNDLVECFEEFSEKESFWLDLQNENELLSFIFSSLEDESIALTFEEVLEITSIFTLLTNENLTIITNASKVADFYNFEHKDKYTFMIAASLCNIGKLFIDDKLLLKQSSLKSIEYEEIKAYPYYTKKVLSNIIGFNDICSYSYKIQEQINSLGYPFKLEGKDLSLKDRVLALVNIFTSLRSKKNYRKAFSIDESFKLMFEMAEEGKVDKTIVNDFKEIFK